MAFDIDVEMIRGERRIAVRIVPADGITVLVGPSGAGKTSLLDAVAGLLRPTEGHVRVAGETLFDAGAGTDLPPARRGAGYVFQDARLFPHRSVRANLFYGARTPPADVDATLDLLGIAHLLDRWPRSLSGGEARRVAIGRALFRAPRFLLLDEPLSSLDAARRSEIMTLIERLRDATALPMLLVTHDQAEAKRLAAQTVTLD